MPENANNEDVKKRIDALISILLRRELKEKSITMRDAIALLSSVGLKYREIASIFGKSPTYIASEITQLRRNKK